MRAPSKEVVSGEERPQAHPTGTTAGGPLLLPVDGGHPLGAGGNVTSQASVGKMGEGQRKDADVNGQLPMSTKPGHRRGMGWWPKGL